jgi:Domain of unknown function (DUF1877)
MRCAKCLKNEASIDFTSVVDGKPQKTVPLCKDCAQASTQIIEAIYRRVTPGEFARLQSDAKAAESFFSPKRKEELGRILEVIEDSEKLPAGRQGHEGGNRILFIGTHWHALHFLLTGDGELKPDPLPPPPLGNVVQGGTATPWPCTHGHVRSLTSDEVRAVAGALSKISVAQLRSRFSVEAFNAAQVYHPGRARWTDEDAESVFEIYPRVVEFFQSAARDGDMILLSSD